MENTKQIIAKNITDLRTLNGMTQIELAEKLNYSDKAVSKWERGESLPDTTVLKEIADMFGVTLDYLVTAEHSLSSAECVNPIELTRLKKRNQRIITGMSILLVWLITLLVFIITNTLAANTGSLLSFVYAIPVSMVVWLVFNTLWFNVRLNFLIVSLLMWFTLFSVWFTIFSFGYNIWLIFTLGIPGQAIIYLWSHIRV